MGYTIVSGNNPSSVALHQNLAIVSLIECSNKMQKGNSKYQYAKIKLDGDVEPTINNLYKIDNIQF